MKSLSLYDSGNKVLVDHCQKIDVNIVVSETNKQLKPMLMRNIIETNGFDIELTTSKTAFDGERYWFICPLCETRVGVVYQHPFRDLIGCRVCLGLMYKSQRYKGMLENKI